MTKQIENNGSKKVCNSLAFYSNMKALCYLLLQMIKFIDFGT